MGGKDHCHANENHTQTLLRHIVNAFLVSKIIFTSDKCGQKSQWFQFCRE